MNNTYAPIIIPTLNRYEHLKRCVESLANNTDADKTELVIGLDYPPAEKYIEGYNKIKEYLPSITGFAKVTILDTPNNIGAVNNVMRLQDYVRSEGYDAFICTEDDNEFSPNYLQYTNWGLRTFKDDKSISYVCGFKRVDVSWLKNNVYKYPRENGWGVATWFDRLDKERSYYDLNKLRTIVDRMTIKVLLTDEVKVASSVLEMIKTGYILGDTIPSLFPKEERYCLFPKVSMVRNYGHDGSGLHGGTNKTLTYYTSLPIETNKTFEPLMVEDLYQPRLKKVYEKLYKTSWKKRLKSISQFLIYKLTGKILYPISK